MASKNPNLIKCPISGKNYKADPILEMIADLASMRKQGPGDLQGAIQTLTELKSCLLELFIAEPCEAGIDIQYITQALNAITKAIKKMDPEL